MVYPDNRILFNTKRKQLSGPKRTWRNLKCIILSERIQSEKAPLLYDSNHMTLWKSETTETIKGLVCQDLGGGMSRWSTEDVSGSETILCDTTMVDECYYTFVKAHGMYTTKAEPRLRPWTLGDKDMSVQVYQLWQMHHSGAGCRQRRKLCMCGARRNSVLSLL